MSTPKPDYPKSSFIKKVEFGKMRLHKGDGDMWPMTWAADDHYYGAAGDNSGSPMNLWRIEDHPDKCVWGPKPFLFLVDNLPMDPKVYCQKPNVNHEWGIKPAGLLSVNGILYFAVELMNFGDNPAFNRQHNINSWIITSTDFGKTWNREATLETFFTGRLASPHFLQFGRDYEGARDEYVYAYFPCTDDGNSYWCNGDHILLGRVHKDKILEREAWEFYTGDNKNNEASWGKDESKVKPVFSYPLMTGENHVSYNKGLRRYIMGNFSFMDRKGRPRPYHQKPGNSDDDSRFPSQLTIFEAPEPWGPWSMFYQDDNWGTHGDYQPNFPTKWMGEDGKTMWMVSSGTDDDYNFTLQKMTLVTG